jgi:DNA-binding response OmpR family regulator
MDTKKNVLVTEDDALLRGILISKFNQSGYAAIGAEDGEIALDIIKKGGIDLIVLDMLMPKKTGLEVLEELHNDSKLSTIPVIIVSNSGQTVEIDKAKALGARDFLIKAVFDPSEVIEKAEKVLNPAAPAAQTPTAAPAASPSAKTVLVIEDDKFLRELLIEKLISNGYNVQGAVDGKEGMELLERTNANLLVLDIILPDINGFEILTKIRSDKRLMNLPVIILSNLDQKEDLDRAIALGVSSFMVKSNFSLGEIAARVKSVLEEPAK